MSRVAITVKPGSKVAGIEVRDGSIIVRVRERAVDGAANEACLRALAKALKLPPSALTIVRGARGRQKLIAIEGIDETAVSSALRR